MSRGLRSVVHSWFLLAVLAIPLMGADPTPTPRFPPLSEEAKIAGTEGMQAFGRGDLVEARLKFEKMRGLSPGHPMALVNLGTILFRQGKFAESVASLQEATRVDPDSAEAWNLLGMVLFYAEKTDEALAALARALVLSPENPKTHNYLGVTIGRKRWFDGAESELRRAIELDPDYADAHFNLALIYLQRDPPDVALARRHYGLAVTLGSPPDPEIEKKIQAGK